MLALSDKCPLKNVKIIIWKILCMKNELIRWLHKQFTSGGNWKKKSASFRSLDDNLVFAVSSIGWMQVVRWWSTIFNNNIHPRPEWLHCWLSQSGTSLWCMSILCMNEMRGMQLTEKIEYGELLMHLISDSL